MYEPVKFKRLGELAKELNDKLEALQIGQLSAEELELLTDHSRELYERLVVLRFKAYTNDVKGTNEALTEATPAELTTKVVLENALPDTEEAPVIAFKVNDEKPSDILPNQVSLIDVIEEVTREETPMIAETPTQEETPATSTIEFEIETPTVEEPSAPLFKVDTPEPVRNTLFPTQESLNDRFAKTTPQATSLASKMESTPIQDLKKAITLNQRFQFSKELFKGNNQDYEVTIDRLNTSTRDEAMKQIAALRSKYAWTNDSPVAADFIDLVERRFS